MRSIRCSILCLLLACGPAQAGVVINEILYHAPNDLDDLQFIELHNTVSQAVSLAGWKFTEGVRYQFPASASIEGGGYVVVCKNKARFKQFYGFDAAGEFEGALSHSGSRIELVDGQGAVADRVRYRSRAPWPVAPDGYSSSLERICPTADNNAENWAPSPLPSGQPRPTGTPGKRNSNYALRLPPIIHKVAFTPTHAAANQAIAVEATIRAAAELKTVEVRYRVAGSGYEQDEQSVAMTNDKKGHYTAKIPGQKPNQILRFRIHAVDAKGGERFYPSEHELRPALSVFVHEPIQPGKIPFGYILTAGNGRSGRRLPPGQPMGEPPTARGRMAFVYIRPKTGEPELFDFINVSRRNAGCKVRFHKDHPLDEMTTINLIYEYMDRFVLAEPLAYEVYRKAGNAAPRTDFVRTWIDGQPLGYQLLVEQPNKAFLKHNHLKTDGNLYKCQWAGHDVASTHEKKTHIHAGHDDIVTLVDQLNRTRGDEQWEVIKKNFDVEQVINYFAVNMVLSHWDGYFNNYFTYHDVGGTGKWTMYPWDQDKTWGFHDGIQGYDVFFDMPLTFGMAGDSPPGWPRGVPAPGGFGFGAPWWRPGGYLSKPLLANPRFRKLFLARTKELVEKVYTEETFFPLIKDMGSRLEEEVKFRAQLHRQDPAQAVAHLNRNLDALRNHLTRRRKFLLEQDEIKKAGAFDRNDLK